MDTAPTLPAIDAGAAPLDTEPIDALFRAMCDLRASDLHLSVGSPPVVRKDGRMQPLTEGAPALTPESLLSLLMPILPAINKKEFHDRHDTDFAYELRGTARFRGNAFMDRAAELYRTTRCPLISIAWGGWASEGMTGSSDVVLQLERNGVRVMQPESALRTMSRALASGDDATIVVSDFDWRTFTKVYEVARRRPLISKLRDHSLTHPEYGNTSQQSDLLVELGSRPQEERLHALVDVIEAEAADRIADDRAPVGIEECLSRCDP